MKIVDWTVMRNGLVKLISKGFILYGASSTGNKILDYLKDLKLLHKVVAVFDSDQRKCGRDWNGYEIYSPERLGEFTDDIPVVITSVFIKEICEYLEGLGFTKNIVNSRCFRLAIHYDVMNGAAVGYLDSDVIDKYKSKYGVWKKFMGNRSGDIMLAQKKMKKVITEYPISILIHAIPKTGNMTLVKSFQGVPNAAVTSHHAYYGENTIEDLHDVLEIFAEHDIRIVTGIREPLEYGISAMWQNVFYPALHNDVCFETVLSKGYASIMETWLKEHLEDAFGIDVFSQLFDKDKGYGILKKGNISVFIYRLDFLSSLEKELGEFAGIKNFKLLNDNQANDKEYVFAYNSFWEEVRVKRELFENVMNSKIMTHFYTEGEREAYQKKWAARLV